MNERRFALETELESLLNALSKDQAELARRQAAAPIKPPVPQKPCDVGLFSDAALQLDIVDMARRK